MKVKALLKDILMIILPMAMVFLFTYQAIHSNTIIEMIFWLIMAYMLNGATSVLIVSTIEYWNKERKNK
ncbi:hypothetical protein [uncultured Peptoniphilus sp.]|uniref:hypothetical protein n=1 Tax=uncultured Peptoniphilus sp. TaxID=254354 RepID=UPI0028050692|nr:hypothetical protein [uncultured Peptoniphilus sp.]